VLKIDPTAAELTAAAMGVRQPAHQVSVFGHVRVEAQL